MKTPVSLLLFMFLTLAQVPGQAPAPLPLPLTASTTGEPPELTQLRQQYALRALASSRILAEQFATALANLARDAGAEGDYEQALKAQRKRLELAEMYSRSLNDPTISNVIVLKPADARINGSVSFDRPTSTLNNWKTVGSTAYWDVQKIVPGKYEVVVTYGVAPIGEMPARTNVYSVLEDVLTGGEFEFYEDSSLPGANLNRRSVQVLDTGGWDSGTTKTLAPVQLTRTTGRFAIKITRTRGSGGVMRLNEVRLVPVKEGDVPAPAIASVDGTSTEPALDEFSRIAETATLRVQKAVEPVVKDYADKLARMSAEAEARKDDELAKELMAETRAIRRLQENPSAYTTSQSATLPTSTLSGQGYVEWQGALFVPSPNNTGDRFLITYNGNSIPVRLLWVSCPPPVPEPLQETKACATYFNITLEDTPLVGRQAKAFTESYLKDKPLRILTRERKDRDGNVLVAVLPEGVGDFAGVLVDNGLACVDTAQAKSRSARRLEEGLLDALKARELAAKARPIPPGAWAMTKEPEGTSNN